jgi:sirohydrochlorin ferrochelatase
MSTPEIPAPQPTLVAVAHGTRNGQGLRVLEELVGLVRLGLAGVDVRLCYLDVATPSLTGALSSVIGPAVVVPVLLSTGYHVKTDIPAAAAGRPGTVITAPIGPDERISAAALDRLASVRGGQGTSGPLHVVAAGSSDPAARQQLAEVAAHLNRATGRVVSLAQLTEPDPFAGVPRTAEVVNYLLAPGYFDNQLHAKAAGRLVGDPIGAHPLAAEVILARYRDAMRAVEPAR